MRPQVKLTVGHHIIDFCFFIKQNALLTLITVFVLDNSVTNKMCNFVVYQLLGGMCCLRLRSENIIAGCL